MRFYDISQPLRPGTPVWPGDQTYESRWSARIGDGSSVNVGAVTMSLHTGTHADAPLHVVEGGTAIHQLPLAAFVGPAVVIETITDGPIGPEVLRRVDLSGAPRILFKTRQEHAPEVWVEDFAHLTPELVSVLAARGVVLVGIDTPSVDHPRSTRLPCHHALYKSRICNIENLDLHEVSEDRYHLVALPLPIEGMDASPVRAILLDKKDTS
jgi:arylformamidase